MTGDHDAASTSGRMTRVRHRSSIIAIGWLLSSIAVAGPPATHVDADGAADDTTAKPVVKRGVPAVVDGVATATRPLSRSAPQRLDLSPPILKSAIAAADADDAPSTAHDAAFGTSTASPQAKIDRAFEAAQIESCGGSGTLKFDALPVWGDFVMGVFALPYALHAMATGRCKL